MAYNSEPERLGALAAAALASLSAETGRTNSAVAAATALFVLPVSADNDAKAAAAKAPSLSGSELYAIHCNRCHSERYPKEFQASQWKTLLTHMRVRANLPASHAKEILKYLQEESGN